MRVELHAAQREDVKRNQQKNIVEGESIFLTKCGIHDRTKAGNRD
jgi:hypothetical protein